MKEKIWVNPDKMLFKSAHKTFNRQTNIISTGNIIANTQVGLVVAAYHTTTRNGRYWEPGYLQRRDLGMFSNIPSLVRSAIRTYAQDEDIFLHEFFHYSTKCHKWPGYIPSYVTEKVIHGYVITRRNRRIWHLVIGPTWKSHSVIMEAIKYITEDNDEKSN